MKSFWLPLICVAIAAAGVWWWGGAGADPHADWRRALRSGDRERQRAALQAIAGAHAADLLPQVAQLWEQVYAGEGFQRTQSRPGSLQPELHAVFHTLGRPAAAALLEWADDPPTRFVPCLLAAGVALDGESRVELGAGAQVGNVTIRRYRFKFADRMLDVPTYLDNDWYGRKEILDTWHAYLAALGS